MAVYFNVFFCLFVWSHPYEALEPLVSGQQFLVEFHSLQVAAAEFSISLAHVVCTLA